MILIQSHDCQNNKNENVYPFQSYSSRQDAGKVTFASSPTKSEMYGGAASRPMAWSGGGSTQVSNSK